VWRVERAIPGVDPSHDELLPFVGPALSLPLWSVLARLPFGPARDLWLVVLAAALVALMAAATALTGIRFRPVDLAIALLFGAVSGPVLSDMSLGQAALVAAAAAFVGEAESRPAGLDLDLADSFKGFVLGVATEKLGGNRDEAFKLLGREKLVAGRNHHKVLKREIERVEALCKALGKPAEFPFSGTLESDDGEERGGE